MTSNPYKAAPNLTDKMNVRGDKYVALSNLVMERGVKQRNLNKREGLI